MALEQKNNLTGKTPSKRASRLTAQQLATVAPAPAKPAPTQTFNRLAPTREAIAQRAYELWLARGCAHGNDVGDWLEAERQLSAK
jgi:hypothetical protein